MAQLREVDACMHRFLSHQPKRLMDVLHTVLHSKGALDIVTIDLQGKTDIADAMIIATGTSSRHVSSLADLVREAYETFGEHVLSLEGQEEGDWVIIDHPEIVVHLFKPECREYFALEKMWGDEAPAEIGEALTVELIA